MRTLPVLLAVVAAASLVPAQAAEPAEAAFTLTGRGVQIYTCTQSATGAAWMLKAPEARLLDAQGNDVGRHFAGPSWQAKDGSLVTGEVEFAASGGPGAVPWLVLRAKTHEGSGAFAAVKAIIRTDTKGGAAPPSGCDASHAGAEVQVPYSASYSFFPG